jgi:bifunctional DNA primase/polymerase-like protein/primase-like protein/uncharacterized protein DUF5906
MTSFAEYAAHGWKLCGIDKGRKAPTYPNWNDNPIEGDALDGLDGAGLLHALSGTAALDIDDLETARPWLAERGVDIDELLAAPTAVMISSGRHNRAKLLYRTNLKLRTLKPTGSGVELRCATADGKSVQDVLPPTVHPDTKRPYEWKYADPLVGHWTTLPPLPAPLLALWRQLLAEVPADKLPTQPRQDVSVDHIRKAIKHYIELNDKDVSDYADWLDIGMRLHEQTGGAQEGLDIWDEWSATDKSRRKNGAPRYEGREAVELHYRSFGKTGGARVGMDGILNQMPAEADEFDVEPEEDPEETTAAKLKKQAAEKKADALALLEKRLVFVDSAEKYFDTKTRRLIQTESGIRNKFKHMMPMKKGGKRANPVELLEDSPTKRAVDYIGFHPGAEATFKDRDGYEYANTFDGTRIPTPIEPTSDELEKIEWLFDRIDDPAYRDWLRQFYGHVVQYPGRKIRSAPLVWSETQGNGKTTLVRMIPSLLVGGRYSQEVTTTQLEDGFTGFLANKWHLYLGEFRVNSRAEREAIAKKVEKWIADDVITVRPMHQVAYDIPNQLFVTASSNYDDAASISNMDRKWAIHHLMAAQFSEAEQDWIYTDFLLLPRAAGVLRYYFQNVDLTGFNPSAKAIQTEARLEMVQASAQSDIEALELALEERSGPFARDVVLVGEVADFLRKAGGFRSSIFRIGKLLTRAPFNGEAIRFRVGDSLFRGVVVRNHKRWVGGSGREIMDHIQGVDDVGTDDADIDLLA